MTLTHGASLPAVAHMPAPNHVEVLSRLALSFQDVIPYVIASFHLEPGAIHLKVGINSGPVIGGVIGKLLPRYRIFGDTVNMRDTTWCLILIYLFVKSGVMSGGVIFVACTLAF